MGKRLYHEHMFQNGVNSFPKVWTRLSLTVDLDVRQQYRMKALNETARALVQTVRYLIARIIAEEVNINGEAVRVILMENFGMK
jgi:hypothetical protein